MEGEKFWGTTNIKVASGVAAFGGKIRSQDPVTRFIKNGQPQVTFWFCSNEETDKVKEEFERPWHEMTCDKESPIRYVRAALENRETLLGLVKRAEPIQVIQNGGQTIIVAENARPELKKAILRAI